MEFKDYYALLGVEPSDDIKAIKAAYRKLARKYHPDVSTEPDAAEKFKSVAEAYEVLKDSERRAEYDQIRLHRHDPHFNDSPFSQSQSRSAGGQEWHNSGDFSDFFESVFGHQAQPRSAGRASQGQRGQDVEMELPLFLEETLKEQSRTISYQLPVHDAFGRVVDEVTKKLNVKIPAGVGDGERIRLKHQGVAGINGGANGDLYLIIRLAPHPLFDIDGQNLQIVVPLAPWEAALGANIEMPTLSGRITLTVPAGSQTGQRLRIKGKGLVSKKGAGDLYAVLKVVMPPKPDESTAAIWTSLAEKAAFNPRTVWE
ncbi:curved DNA-binding protein [Lonsdalea quercina]|uniref:curved DNA-binding protein n=1 Tax=Lonsdalea quercina TaxID=71657 RepID=UPI000479F589|nr:curved DNA-binding protein [Lonsdalea quercina]